MRIIRLTESDLEKIVKKVLKEDPAPLPDMENAPLGKVEAIQQALVDAGYDVGPTGVDGKFGSNTRAAVIKYQKDNGIKQTGNVGPLTGGKLGVQPLTSGKPSPTQPKASTRPQDKSKVPSFNLGNNLIKCLLIKFFLKILFQFYFYLFKT
jgi:peptidoglycan hydrolase-like protein with peptidoglycan-binding domain